MNEKQEYADQWSVSSKYFYDQRYYDWMCEKLRVHNIVFEIGCGTGYSTLSLLENGHKVIASDKNLACIERAKNMILEHGFSVAETIDELNTSDVHFIGQDIVTESFYTDILPTLFFDAVICWNIGSYWNVDMIKFYSGYMQSYGLTIAQIKENPESSYAELILWHTCNIAKKKNAVIHIVDRVGEIINQQSDFYYHLLQTEFGYQTIAYDNLNAKSISTGGRLLVTNGCVNKENFVDIFFDSVLIS